MWAEIVKLGVAGLVTIGLLFSSAIRAVVKSIFRRPSKPTLLVKAGDTWVDVSDDRVVSEKERDLLTKMAADTPTSDSHDSRNGGAGTNG